MRVIVLEGINGSGKSTVGKRLQDAFVEAHRPCLWTDAAVFGPVGKLLRKYLIDPKVAGSPDLDSLLFATLRAEGAGEINQIAESEPALTVVLERWSVALSAYGAIDGAAPQLLSELRDVLVQSLKVDLTVLLDVSGNIAFGRIKDIADTNRYESRGAQYLDRVAQNYREFIAGEENAEIIDASGNETATFEQLLKILTVRWPELRNVK